MDRQVLARIRSMVAGSLRYYASESTCEEEEAQAEMLELLAERIENGTATTEEWLEAIDQVDVSDLF